MVLVLMMGLVMVMVMVMVVVMVMVLVMGLVLVMNLRDKMIANIIFFFGDALRCTLQKGF